MSALMHTCVDVRTTRTQLPNSSYAQHLHAWKKRPITTIMAVLINNHKHEQIYASFPQPVQLFNINYLNK